jgi:hypothetical protein
MLKAKREYREILKIHKRSKYSLQHKIAFFAFGSAKTDDFWPYLHNPKNLFLIWKKIKPKS